MFKNLPLQHKLALTILERHNLPCFLHEGNQKSSQAGIYMKSKIILLGKFAHFHNGIYNTMRKLWGRANKLKTQISNLEDTNKAAKQTRTHESNTPLLHLYKRKNTNEVKKLYLTKIVFFVIALLIAYNKNKTYSIVFNSC